MHPRHCQLLHREVLSGSRPQPLHVQSLLSDLLRNCMPALKQMGEQSTMSRTVGSNAFFARRSRGGTSLSLADSFPAMGTSSWKADDVDFVIASIVLPLFLYFAASDHFDMLRLSNKRQESVRNTAQYGSTKLDQRNTLHHLSNCHTSHSSSWATLHRRAIQDSLLLNANQVTGRIQRSWPDVHRQGGRESQKQAKSTAGRSL